MDADRLLSDIRRITPSIAARAERTEDARRLPPDVSAELVGTNVTNAVSADFAFPPPDPTLPSSVQIASPSPLRQITLRASMQF